MLTEYLQDTPVTTDHICSWTQKDPILSKVIQFFQQGWPNHGESFITPLFFKKGRAIVYEDYILWGS